MQNKDAAMNQPRLTLCELADTGLPRFESYSPFCLKAHRALRAAGLRYERRHGAQPASHRAHHPLGQVPVLLIDHGHGIEAVPDSSLILQRVAQLAPGRLGDDAPAPVRAEALLWEELGDTALNAFLVAARWADERNWPAVRAAYFPTMPAPVRLVVPALLRRGVLRRLVAREVWRGGAAACWRRFIDLLDTLEARAPEQGFWLGAGLSVADLGLFAQLHSLRAPLTPWQGEQIGQRPRLTAYLDRVDAATAGA